MSVLRFNPSCGWVANPVRLPMLIPDVTGKFAVLNVTQLIFRKCYHGTAQVQQYWLAAVWIYVAISHSSTILGDGLAEPLAHNLQSNSEWSHFTHVATLWTERIKNFKNYCLIILWNLSTVFECVSCLLMSCVAREVEFSLLRYLWGKYLQGLTLTSGYTCGANISELHLGIPNMSDSYTCAYPFDAHIRSIYETNDKDLSTCHI